MSYRRGLQRLYAMSIRTEDRVLLLPITIVCLKVDPHRSEFVIALRASTFDTLNVWSDKAAHRELGFGLTSNKSISMKRGSNGAVHRSLKISEKVSF